MFLIVRISSQYFVIAGYLFFLLC